MSIVGFCLLYEQNTTGKYAESLQYQRVIKPGQYLTHFRSFVRIKLKCRVVHANYCLLICIMMIFTVAAISCEVVNCVSASEMRLN